MHIKESGVLYDVYVKNDIYYQKSLILGDDTYDENDKSFNDYINDVHTSMPKFAGLLMGHVFVHVLPESSTDKTSSSTEDVSDDIAGIVSTQFAFEGDKTESMGVTTYENYTSHYQPNEKEASMLLSKLTSIYKKDTMLSTTVERYSDAANYVYDFMTKGVDENGDTLSILSALDNPLGFAIATLAGDATGKTIDDAMEVQSFSAKGTMEEKLKELAEEKKRENEKALLKTSNASNANFTVEKELR
ncbi:MAG: hypothetical protein J0647_06545 [Campylobacteraceae bacterium]|nr:hypothetical protein [Campylobacteraceae bacterium]